MDELEILKRDWKKKENSFKFEPKLFNILIIYVEKLAIIRVSCWQGQSTLNNPSLT